MDFAHPEVTARAGIDALRQFLTRIGMPVNFKQLGARAADIPRLVATLCRSEGRDGSIHGFVSLNEEDCTRIYQMMV